MVQASLDIYAASTPWRPLVHERAELLGAMVDYEGALGQGKSARVGFLASPTAVKFEQRLPTVLPGDIGRVKRGNALAPIKGAQMVADKEGTTPITYLLVRAEGEAQRSVAQEQANVRIELREIGVERGDAVGDLWAIPGEGTNVVVRGAYLADVGDQAGGPVDAHALEGTVKELTRGSYKRDSSDLFLLTGSLPYNGNS
jgi:hypothetical protein